MSLRQFQEIRLRDFRCFGEQQAVPLAPLTLLVGENSTGKTSFLAAVQAAWDAAHGSGAPDFRKAPYDLGAFPEIVHGRTGRGSRPNSFAIGFKVLIRGERPESSENLRPHEANAWAADKLIPPRYVPDFVSLYDKASVYAFASKVGVHPGIVVGRLQHDRLIPFGRMNDLKATFKFVEASGA